VKRKSKGNFDQVLAPLLFLLPNSLIFIVFVIVPAFQGLRMAFYDWGILSVPEFIGMGNFILLLSDVVFWRTFMNTLIYSVFVVPFMILVALFLALLLQNNSMKGVSAFKAMFYIPSLLSMITVGIAWRFILGNDLGVINYVLTKFGVQGVNWLTSPNMAMASIITVSVWAGAGYFMVILIAGLHAIPLDLYEAARIDGASTSRVFLHITLPLLKSTMLVTFVLATIASFKAYELIFVMTQGGPGYATKFIVQQVYQGAFMEDRMGYASAMSIVLMLLIIVFTSLQFKVTGKDQDYE